MIDDIFVFDATVHSFNLDRSNVQPNRWAQTLHRAFLDWHLQYADGVELLPEDLYLRDWPAEALTEILFRETSTDMGGHHTLRMDSWFKDGFDSFEKNLEISKRWPHRYVIYLGVDPTMGDRALDELREQHAAIPTAVGLKIYPAQVDPYRSWRADDREAAFPLFELVGELGLKTVAFHKALAVMGVPTEPYRTDDIEGAAMAFPDLNFEIVHAGNAFLEDTAHLIGRFENVYANLEITSLLCTQRPVLFDEIMSTMLYWGGAEKILYASGCMEWHSQSIIEALARWQPSEEMQRRFRLSPLGAKERRLIFGENYARMLGLDLDECYKRIENDEFAIANAEFGLAQPYSDWRARCSTA